MKEMIRLVVALTLISAVAGLMLAFTNARTLKPIADARAAEKLDALAEVLPPFDNSPATTTNVIREGTTEWVFHVARKQGQYAGCAFESVSRNGYGGNIILMLGVSADGQLYTLKILQQQETPGLGTKVNDPAFRGQFNRRPAADTRWRLTRDGGDIQGITGATISSRAVTEAVREGLAVYLAHRAEIEQTGAEPAAP